MAIMQLGSLGEASKIWMSLLQVAGPPVQGAIEGKPHNKPCAEFPGKPTIHRHDAPDELPWGA